MDADLSERWPELDELFERAREYPASEQEAFLAEACAGDPELRHALERLLAAHAESEELQEGRSAPLGEPSGRASGGGALHGPTLEDRTVSHFEILESVGSGGMGVVYKARDTHLDRLVTLKFLRSDLVTDEAAKARFIQEAKAASALDHANICTIHDIAETDDGQLYIEMAYYAGETLKERLARGRPSVEESVEIGRQLAAGLERAHEAGIVHRDLKPANVMITERGEVKILDFGIAKLEGGADLTQTGLLVGTVTYMSPEQASGAPVDHRTDVWALGVLLYEMLAGRRPFRAPTDPAVVYSILHTEPQPVSELRSDVPEALEAVVRRALAKDPEARFPDMGALGAALGSQEAMSGRRAPRRVLVGAAALTAVLVAVGLASLLRAGGDPEAPPSPAAGAVEPGIAVLPFDVAGSDLEEWREGLVTLLSTGLDGAGGLRAISSRTVFAYWDELERGGVRVDQAASLAIARETGARYAVLGSAVAIGPRVRLVADVYEALGETSLGQRQVQGPPDSVLALVDQLAVGILGLVLDRREGDLPPVDVASITTTSIPAVKAFLEGEVQSRSAQFDEAIEAYTRALAEDSTFALAHYHMASAYAWRGNLQSPSARRHREAALRFIDRLPEREAALVRARHATGEQRPEAVDLLEEAVARHPDDAEAWFLLGDAHLHTRALTGPEEADRAFQRAAELDPGFALYQPHGIELAFNLRADSAIAASRLAQYGAVTGGGAYYRAGELAVALAFGSADARAEARASLDTIEVGLLPFVTSFLNHPRHWEAQEGVYRALRDGTDRGVWRTTSADQLAAGSLWRRGRLRRALEYLAHPAVSQVTRICLPAVARGWGLPVPEDVLIEVLSVPIRELQEPLHFTLACRGYIAADLARWGEHAATVAEADARAALAREQGDAVSADRLKAAATELRGYALWRQGRPTDALPLLGEAREVAWYLGEWPRRMHRKAFWYPDIWPGLIHLELERSDAAVPYFLRLWYNPLAHLRLGQIHQAAGDGESAREALEYFLEAWNDADPALRPWVEEARAAFTRADGRSSRAES